MQGYLVVCLIGEQEDHENAGYTLATRSVFRTRSAAENYASTIAESRKALVIWCPLGVEFREADARWK